MVGGMEEELAWMETSKEVEPDRKLALKSKSENLEEEKGVESMEAEWWQKGVEWRGEEEERRSGSVKGRRGRKSGRGMKSGESKYSLGWEAVCLLEQVG